MATICFDLGGTLIDDPFPDATEELKQEVQNGTVLFPFSSKLVDEFFEAWTEHNRSFDFPFASHYLQEEVWLIRAAISIDSNHNLGMGGVLPFRIPVLLSRYRAIAARKVALQPQLPMILIGDKVTAIGWSLRRRGFQRSRICHSRPPKLGRA